MNLSFKALSFLGLVGVGAGVGGTYGSVVKTNAEENKKFMEAKKELSSSWKNFESLFDSILQKYNKTNKDLDDGIENKWEKISDEVLQMEGYNPKNSDFQSTNLNDLQNKKQELEEMSKELKEISKSLEDN